MEIKRSGPIHNGRMSTVVQHGDVLYLCGLLAGTAEQNAKEQTEEVLALADTILSEHGSDKSHLLSASIYLHDIQKNFQGMNEAWDNWVDRENPPARICVEANMSDPAHLVEILFVAVRK